MNTVVAIDSTKIVEILFENSQNIPENDYIFFMNLMKEYHETGDNEDEIINYVETKIKDPVLKNKIQKYISCKNPKCHCRNLKLFCSCRFCGVCCGCLFIIGFFTSMAINILGVGVRSSPQSNFNGTN